MDYVEPLFGWELTWRVVNKDIKRKSDVLYIFAHWLLSKKGFKCIDLGETEAFTGKETTSDIPSDGWNKDENYCVRYNKDGELYILRGVKADDELVFNFLRNSDLEVTSVGINISESVPTEDGSIEEVLPNYKNVISLLEDNLIKPILPKKSKSATTQTSRDTQGTNLPGSNAPDPLRVGAERHPRSDSDFLRDPLRVGRNDLDPFGGFGPGGGMLFDPFRDRTRPDLRGPLAGLPRGAVPPGSRFDPFGPPDIDEPRPRRPHAGPNPDHLNPPGFDNMFM